MLGFSVCFTESSVSSREMLCLIRPADTVWKTGLDNLCISEEFSLEVLGDHYD